MDDLLRLIVAILSVTLLDIDNAVYSAKRIGTLQTHQRLALFLCLSLEFIGRLLLLALFAILSNEQEALFTIFGIEFTIETIALLTAGVYLLISNGREFMGFLSGQEEPASINSGQDQKLAPFLLKTALILTLMSVDTILVITSYQAVLGVTLLLLIVSAVLRFLFIDKLVTFIEKFPAVKLLVTILLIAVGLELIIQGLGYDQEAIFNLLLVLVILLFVAIQQRSAKPADGDNSAN